MPKSKINTLWKSSTTRYQLVQPGNPTITSNPTYNVQFKTSHGHFQQAKTDKPLLYKTDDSQKRISTASTVVLENLFGSVIYGIMA